MTPKQTRFVEEYLIDLNATQAAIRAGYSENTADVIGCENLGKPYIAAAIAEAQAKLAEKAGVSAERIVQEFCCLGLYDPADIASQGISGPEDIASLPENVRRAIIGWSWDRNGNFILKLADKAGSLVNLGRHLGMFTDKVQHSGKIELEQMTDADIAKRIAEYDGKA